MSFPPTLMLLTVLTVPCLALTSPSQPVQVELDEGLIVDAQSGVVYLMESSGGIAARRAGDGQLIWRSDHAERPVLILNDRLLAQKGGGAYGKLPVALLDIGDGTVVKTTTLTIPSSVLPTIDDRLDSRFVMRAEGAVAGDKAVWRYEYARVQGMQRNITATPLRVAGVVSVGVAQISVSGDPAPVLPRRSVIASPTTGVADDRVFRSANGRHMLKSSRLDTADLSRRYQWQVFHANGERLGEFPAPVSYTPFVVVNDTLLYVSPQRSQLEQHEMVKSPLSLRAIDLRRGAEAWNTAIRDTQYRGPFPP